jgi:hypothetical protein
MNNKPYFLFLKALLSSFLPARAGTERCSSGELQSLSQLEAIGGEGGGSNQKAHCELDKIPLTLLTRSSGWGI